MRRVLDASEVLGEIDTTQGECDVCASASASYDEEHGKLVVDLDAFLRTRDIRVKERRPFAEWLPKGERICESAAPDETGDMARDIFHRWARKVRDAIPALKTH